jgi:hypothetical protein
MTVGDFWRLIYLIVRLERNDVIFVFNRTIDNFTAVMIFDTHFMIALA